MFDAKKYLLAASVALSLYSGVAQSGITYSNNFTVLDPTGSLAGGTNDYVFSWDGSLNTSFQDNGAGTNASLVPGTMTPFYGLSWSVYNVSIYGPGTYIIPTADTIGSGDCPLTAGTCVSGGNYNVTVGAGQIMAHMKFGWGATLGIDIVNVWQAGSWDILNPGDPIWMGGNGLYIGPYYDFVSVDWDGDGIAGGAMIDGPFPGFSFNFNVNVVPVPAAVWLFASGLVGLLGLARRRKKS